MGEIHLAGFGGRRVGEIVVYLAFGNDDPVVDFPVTHAAENNLLTNVLAKVVPVHAVVFYRCFHVADRDIIALGDAADGGVEIAIGYREAGFLGILQLDTVHDEALQHLLDQHVLGRRRDILAAQLLHGGRKPLLEVIFGDCFTVDDSNNAVGRNDGRRCGLRKTR